MEFQQDSLVILMFPTSLDLVDDSQYIVFPVPFSVTRPVSKWQVRKLQFTKMPLCRVDGDTPQSTSISNPKYTPADAPSQARWAQCPLLISFLHSETVPSGVTAFDRTENDRTILLR